MTTFTINLTDGRQARVEADEITMRQDGSLWALQAVAKPPAKLEPVAIFAARQWLSCFPENVAIQWTGEPRGKQEPEPHLLMQAEIPDQFRSQR